MSPPKTGTTSIRRALEIIGAEPFIWGEEEGIWESHNPTADTHYFDPHGHGSLKHRCHLPKELASYYVFASVRNPYTRQISRHLQEKWDRQFHCQNEDVDKILPSQLEFEKFTFGTRTSPQFSCSGWLNLYPDHRPPKGCVPFNISRFVKLETISQDFNSLPFVPEKIEFPHKNTCKYPGVSLHFTTRMSKHLFDTMKADFENFNYDAVEIKIL